MKAAGCGRTWVLALGLVLALAFFPQVASPDIVSLGFVALQYALFALGLNIVVGWAGLLDLGAAGFVAVGAYTAAICLTQLAWPSLFALLATFVSGFAAGIILGIPTLRHRLDYFAILTLGFAELVALSIRNWPAVTRGSYGYSGIPALRLPFLEEPLRAVPPAGYFYLLSAILLISYTTLLWLRRTAFGRHLHVVKHSEAVAHAYGINVLRAKLAAFGLSAALLSLGGFFWASYHRSVVWTEFGILLSCLFVSTLVVGGLGNPAGVVTGAAIVGSCLELIRRLLTALGLPQNTRFLLFAVALVAFVHIWPQGLLPDRPAWLSRLRFSSRRRSAPSWRSGALAVLEVIGVTKTFGGVVALDDLTFRLMPGECIALIGPNGSGKTTLLNILSGFLRPDRGEVRLAKNRLDLAPPYQIARRGVGRSFQDVSVIDDISIGDNVFITARAAAVQEVEEVVQFFDLGSSALPCSALSYGSKKALDLARLFADPGRWRLLLLDEPTAGLAESEAMRVVESLARLRRRERFSMVVVSHDIKFLEALELDRVIVLHQGKLFREGRFSELCKSPDFRELFWGDEEVFK